jgi:retron-type reverse transcriptase
MMHGREKSDPAIVARKPANNAGQPAAERVERRAGTEGNAGQQSTRRAQDRESVSQALERVRQAAKQKRKERFTALFHHLNPEMLRTAFFALKRDAAAGVDRVRWQDYEADLDRRIEDLSDRVHRGAYRAQPSRRRYIPKPDGRQRPLWLVRFVEHRVGDPRIIRLIRKWLKAGVLEDGVVTTSERGTGQGSVISPLLANIYLHYVFDLWAARWRRREATGDMVIVRYADDIVVGFEHEPDGRRFLDLMRERLAEFALTLHPEKTRLIAFGHLSAAQRAKLGLGKPETFDFLGFTHICGRTRQGRFQIRRKSRRDRRWAKLREIKDELRRRILQPIPEQGRWLRLVITGYYAYHAVPTNFRSLYVFREHVVRLWGRTLRRRSQKHALTWERMGKVADDWLPQPRILHPWPSIRFAVKHPR